MGDGAISYGNSSKGSDMNMHATTQLKTTAQARARRVVHRTRGNSHGSITRLVSPSDVGELIKPFVFLDYFEIDPERMPAIGWHPHSGIATLSLILEGQIAYEDTSGAKGIIEPGGVEWMRAGSGVWHTGGPVGTARVKGYQLWVALPPEMENIASEARYLGREHFQSHGPARVILGRLGGAASKVPAPATMNYLDVALAKGELAVFEESNGALEFEPLEDTGFILGSAVKHPHDLALGMYSVHTSQQALERGEAKIAEIGKRLRAEGRL